MDRSFRDEYPEYKKYHKKKKFPTWILIIICLIISGLPGYLLLIQNKIAFNKLFGDTQPKPQKSLFYRQTPNRIKAPNITKRPQDTTEKIYSWTDEKIYSWTDETGIKHFSNVQPSETIKT